MAHYDLVGIAKDATLTYWANKKIDPEKAEAIKATFTIRYIDKIIKEFNRKK